MPNFSAILAGTGSCLPERRLTNDDLSKMVETNDEWITQRTGIKERRIASAEETTASLGTIAAKRAIESAGLEPKDIELIIVATITPEMVFPSTACFIGAELGVPGVPAFDMMAACSGFLYAMVTGANFIRAGQYKNVLVIGAETLSRIVNYKDRNSCILFGDGAGAVVLKRSEDAKRGLIYSTLHADGSGGDVMKCMPGSRHPICADMISQEQQFMQIRGREVYKFAVSKFGELIESAMRACELSKDDVKYIIPHQVNLRIIDSAMEKLGMPPSQAYVNIQKYGNTSAASIPIALDEAWRTEKIEKNDVLVFVAFGGGLTWANAVVRACSSHDATRRESFPMSNTTFILCPGQGAQVVGMGKDFYDASPAAKETFDAANKVLGFDVASLCFSGPEAEQNKTNISQPAIYVTSIAAYRAAVAAGVLSEGGTNQYAGLSLGEYTALHLAGVFGFEDGLRLVAARGKYMQEAAEATPSTMVAVLGGDEAAVTKLCAEQAQGDVLVAANFNSPGQVVISGSKAACERAIAAAGAAGLKTVPLAVAGAFHSPIMQSGADKMKAELDRVTFNPPRATVYSNVTASPHTDPASIKKLLVDQIIKPVRWQQTMEKIAPTEGARFVELAPGRSLTGMMKKINRRLPVENLATVEALSGGAAGKGS